VEYFSDECFETAAVITEAATPFGTPMKKAGSLFSEPAFVFKSSGLKRGD
jgi:hypothetical protein